MTERSLEDRMGEAIRLHWMGPFHLPWEEAFSEERALWVAAASQLLDNMKKHGLKVVVQEGDSDE